MRVFRLCKSEYSQDLSGAGARKAGGRWNSKGTAMVYTAMSRSLCLAELAVHLPLGILPVGYRLVTLSIPDDVPIAEVEKSALPSGWRSFPYQPDTQEIGNHFISDGRNAVLRVPSAIIPGEYNYLINPGHPDVVKITITESEDFSFDDRLFVR